MPTRTAAVGQQVFAVPTSSDLSDSLVQTLLNTAATLGIGAVFSATTAPLPAAALITASPARVTVVPATTTVLDTEQVAHTVIGGGGSQQVLLDGRNATYVTGSSLSTVAVSADGANSSIVNNTPNGALIAVANAGANALVGGGGANAFATSAASQDVVLFSGIANSLDSAGHDLVTIVGGTRADAITVEAGGSDAVTLLGGAGMSFLNNSDLTSTVTGSPASQVTIRGSGTTRAAAGSGYETLDAGSSTGAVTLAAGTGNAVLTGGSGADSFVFTRGQAGGQDTIVNFTPADTLQLSGYGGAGAIQSETVGGGSVTLTLVDSTRITFQGLGLLNAAQISIA